MGNMIEADGTIIEALPGEVYRVRVDNGHELNARVSDQMRASYVRVLVGDRVTVQIDASDLRNGLITNRYK